MGRTPQVPLLGPGIVQCHTAMGAPDSLSHHERRLSCATRRRGAARAFEALRFCLTAHPKSGINNDTETSSRREASLLDWIVAQGRCSISARGATDLGFCSQRGSIWRQAPVGKTLERRRTRSSGGRQRPRWRHVQGALHGPLCQCRLCSARVSEEVAARNCNPAIGHCFDRRAIEAGTAGL